MTPSLLIRSRWSILAATLLAVVLVIVLFKPFGGSDFTGVPKRAVEYYETGSKHLDEGDVEKGLVSLLKAIEIDGTFSNALARAGEAYYRAAQGHRATQNLQMVNSMLEQSHSFTERALALDPDNGFAHLVLGLHQFDKNNLDSALYEFEMAQKADIHTFEFHSMLGFLYNQKEETTKCIEQYQKALALKPTDSKTISNLAELYFAVGSYSRATELFGELMKYEPENDRVKANYAVSLWMDGNEKQAKQLLNDLLESKGGNKFRRYNTVAWILIDKNVDINWGIKLAKSAYDLKPRNLESVDILGWGYYKAGDYANAVTFLNMSMRMKPSEEVKRRLDMAKEKLDAMR